MLKKYWIWTSSGLLILGSIEAWLSGFSYIPFAWVLAVMNSVVALVIKGLATFFRALRKLFSPINYEPLLVASDFQHNASKSHRKNSHSAFNDPLDPNIRTIGLMTSISTQYLTTPIHFTICTTIFDR